MGVKSTEFLVVGGGPVGSSLALQLHRAGRDVLLVDAGASPGKVCGEGLLPPGWAALEALGVASLIEDKARISELVYQMPDPRTGRLLSVTAAIDSPSYGVRREVLCQAFARAAEQSGLEVWRPARFRQFSLGHSAVQVELDHDGPVQVECRYLIGADGLHSAVRRQAGLQSSRERAFSRWGTRVYARGDAGKGVVVTLGDSVESYRTPLGADLFGLAFLWYPHKLGRPLAGEGPTWSRLIERFPSSFRDTLPPLSSFFGSDHAIGPLQQQVTSPLHKSGRIALVGDAAGYLDALTGEGLCLGMQQSHALAGLLLRNQIGLYPAAHRSIKMRHQIVVQGLLRLLSHPALRERVFRALHGTPGMLEAVVAVAIEHQPWRRLVTPAVLSFLLRVVAGSGC